MLPQFGFIVAQAGADAHFPPTQPPPGNPALIGNQHPSPLLYPHRSSPSREPAALRDDYNSQHRPYYTRLHSPPPTQPSTTAVPAPPVLPPPMSYMYGSEYNNRQNIFSPYDRQSLPPPRNDAPSTTSSSFRPLTPSTWRDDLHMDPPSSTFSAAPASSAAAPLPPLPLPSHHALPSLAPPVASSNSVWHTPPPSSSYSTYDHHTYDDPYHPQYEARWENQDTAGAEGKAVRRLRECNDLMTSMDSEFWENSESIYQNKLQSLQGELRSVQEGTHEGFLEEVAELEKKRDKTLVRAKAMRAFEMSVVIQQYDDEITTARQEYEGERHNLHDVFLAVIEDRRKLIREDRDNGHDLKDLFRDVQQRVSHRRNLRRRGQDRLQNNSPSRHDVSSRRRQHRTGTPYNIHASPNAKEEEELANDLAQMRGAPPTKKAATTGPASRR